MHLQNPTWIDYSLLDYKVLSDVPDALIEEVKLKLKSRVSENPVITVIITAWNEEVNIIRSLLSIANNETTIPFDLLVVNNNSTDRTQEVLDKLEVLSIFQPIQGAARRANWGNAMQKENIFCSLMRIVSIPKNG